MASEPASGLDLLVVRWVLWVVGWMDIGWAGAVSVFKVGPGADLLVGKVAPKAAVLMVEEKVHRILFLTVG